MDLDLETNDGKFKVRKVFSAFANTRGGWIIVGVTEEKKKGRVTDYKIVGVLDSSLYGKLRDILSTDEYIRPRVELRALRAIPPEERSKLRKMLAELGSWALGRVGEGLSAPTGVVTLVPKPEPNPANGPSASL